MKTGPHNGLYQRLLDGKFKGEPPSTSSSLRRKNPREHNRRVAIRALYRRQNDGKKLKKFGKWVRSIRTRLKKSRNEFAKLVGVSRVTIVRWELALGHMPATYPKKNKHGKLIPSNMERLQELDVLCKELKESNTEVE